MKISRILVKVTFGLVIIFCIVFTLFYGKNKISNKALLGETENYKGIITLWQVDSFEGGIGSRKQFLLKASRSFERKNPGVLVMVIEHTEESLKEELKKGILPDMISFGAGVEITGLNQLNFKTVSGGMIGDKVYATAWCRGGYSIIANPKLTSKIDENLDNLIVSQAKYTQPLTALYLEEYKTNELKIKQPMDAYVEFVLGKTPYLLGTQRDIIRLERREMEVISKPLEQFNDLYQYICVTATDSVKNFYSQNFIEHLLSEEIQKSIKEIGMFSTTLSVDYDNEHLIAMQKLNNFSTVSAFSSAIELKQMQENSLLLLGGRLELENKIKNMLV